MKYRQKINGQWSNWINFNIKALDGMPIGTILIWSASTGKIPTGWLLCDGTTLNEEEYPELFDIIGHTYGGSNLDFNLPNFKGRVPVGQDTTQTEFNNLSKTGGSKYLQRHSHQQSRSYQTAGFSAPYQNPTEAWGLPDTTGTGAFINNIEEAGTGDSGNLQPYIVVNYIIKATNTTPTMASVVNATNNSTEDTYSCDYSNKHYGGVVLYNDTTGTTGNITLSETTANFKYIEIYAVDNDSRTNYFNVFKFNASSSTFNISSCSASANKFAIFTALYTNNGTTLTNGGHYLYNGSIASYPVIRVMKIIGYK